MTNNPLHQKITEEIKKRNTIPFDEFMEMALYFPKLGYYTRNNIKIGKEGDFFTASHLGKIFGILLVRYIKTLWERLEYPQNFSITEIGPAMGYLCEDIMEELLNKENMPSNFKYNLVEINPYLKQRQQERLIQYLEWVRWYSSIEDLFNLNGVVICNEIFDAFPVRIFEVKKGKLYEIYVTIDEKGNFFEKIMPPRKETVEFINEFAQHVLELDEYRSEINLRMKEFIEKLSKSFQKGFLLVFDYGFSNEEYYHPQRKRGTLLCYHKHTINENPYINVGLQDITSHVNFSVLQKWANDYGFKLIEYMSQSRFLVSLCDETILERLKKQELIDKFKRLILPQGMGDTHRVMIFFKP
jgi:SAM-dependent MidA family methyltransferase